LKVRGHKSGPTRCDTEKYTANVNVSNIGAGLCGATDWRLPSLQELGTIVNYNQVTLSQQTYSVDINYFPNSQPSLYWSSSVVTTMPGTPISEMAS